MRTACGQAQANSMIRELFPKKTAVLNRTALGETAISFAALGQLAEQTARRQKGVLSCRTRAYAVGSSVWIDVHAQTPPELSLIEITHTLEKAIAEELLRICGSTVGTVYVTVEQPEQAPKRT